SRKALAGGPCRRWPGNPYGPKFHYRRRNPTTTETVFVDMVWYSYREVLPDSKSQSRDDSRAVPVVAAFSPIPVNGIRSLIWPRRPHVVASVLMGSRLGHLASIQRQGFPTPQTGTARCGGDETPSLWASLRCNGARTHIHKAESSDGLV